MTNHSPSHYPDIGALGEDLVAKWLAECGWNILHRRWRCRLGEIDIIAEYKGKEEGVRGKGVREDGEDGGEMIYLYSPSSPSNTLAFIEVKTRSAGNWDAGGRDAITFRKQQKLWRTAQLFLVKYPQKADFNCRFDVALVFSKAISKNLDTSKNSQSLASTTVSGYYLALQEYIAGAFDSL